MTTCSSLGNWIDASKIKPASVPTRIYFDVLPSIRPIGRWIYVQVEPEAIFQREKIIRFLKADFIITYNSRVLAACPNAYKFIYGTTWIPRERWGSRAKTYNVSGLFGTKMFTSTGHPFRLQMYMEQRLLTVPYTFYRSSRQHPVLPEITHNPFIHDSKDELFNSQFSIAIENSREENYFTEKLLDCLLTQTIPIYYGCPNIRDYFDTTGWILLESENIEAAMKAINALTPEWYDTHKSVIESNYVKAQEYADVYTNINRALSSIPGY